MNSPSTAIRFRRMLAIILILLIFLILLRSGSAEADDLFRIVIVKTMPVPVVVAHDKWIANGLEKLGYVQGKNLDLLVIEARGDREIARSQLLRLLDENPPDLVITIATMATQAAKEVLQGTSIPLVFCVVSDPVGAGIVDQIGASTGCNVTGLVYTVDRAIKIGTVMNLIGRTVSSRPVRFGFIHSSYPSAVGDLRELNLLAGKRGDVAFVSKEVKYRKVPEGMASMLEDTARAASVFKDQIDFWWEPSDPIAEVSGYTRALLIGSDVPIAFGNNLDSVKLGALIHLTPNWEQDGQEVARLADKILKGCHPGDIPVTPPAKFDLGVNSTTAQNLGITLPPHILELAKGNIYR